jgi:hypothetical protein
MKIQIVFILFNAMIILFLAVMGAAFGGGAQILGLRLWLLAGLCAALLVSFDVYYLINYKLLNLLLKDDWHGLVRYLEDKVLVKGHFSARYVRLLAQAYFILSDTPALLNLENKTALAKPRLVEEFALIFGMARLIERNMAHTAHFFEARLHSPTPNKRDLHWIRFYYGFTMLLDWHFPEACDEFIILSKVSTNPLITGVSAWFLADYLDTALPDRRDEIESAIAR